MDECRKRVQSLLHNDYRILAYHSAYNNHMRISLRYFKYTIRCAFFCESNSLVTVNSR